MKDTAISDTLNKVTIACARNAVVAVTERLATPEDAIDRNVKLVEEAEAALNAHSLKVAMGLIGETRLDDNDVTIEPGVIKRANKYLEAEDRLRAELRAKFTNHYNPIVPLKEGEHPCPYHNDDCPRCISIDG